MSHPDLVGWISFNIHPNFYFQIVPLASRCLWLFFSQILSYSQLEIFTHYLFCAAARWFHEVVYEGQKLY